MTSYFATYNSRRRKFQAVPSVCKLCNRTFERLPQYREYCSRACGRLAKQRARAA